MAKPGWHGTNSGPEPPCYDRSTDTDCPNRCGGCQLKCEKWAAYVIERDKVYEQRKIEFLANSVIGETRCDARDKHIRKQQRMKRYYR